MVYRGHVENGVIRSPDSVVLPDGAEVRAEIVAPANGPGTPETGLSLYDRLKPLIGAATNLPPDASVNIDHYLYSHPKK